MILIHSDEFLRFFRVGHAFRHILRWLGFDVNVEMAEIRMAPIQININDVLLVEGQNNDIPPIHPALIKQFLQQDARQTRLNPEIQKIINDFPYVNQPVLELAQDPTFYATAEEGVFERHLNKPR